MNSPERSFELARIAASAILTRDEHASPVDAQSHETDNGHHQKRLARLFRHGSDRAADRYLLDLMGRYRGVKSS
jgi:hypothetical protein